LALVARSSRADIVVEECIMKRSFVLAALAGSCVASVASAQMQQTIPNQPISYEWVLPDGSITTTPPAGNVNRAIQPVYNSSTGTCLIYIGAHRILDDVNFNPGPWAATSNNSLSTINIYRANSGTAPASFTIFFRLWAAASFTANPMVSGTPIVTVGPSGVTNTPVGAVIVRTFGSVATPLNVIIPGSSVFVEVINSVAGGTITQQLPLGGTQPFHLLGINNVFPVNLGSSSTSLGIDANNDTVLDGTTAENATPAFGAASACVGQNIVSPHLIQGDVVSNAPSTFENISIAEGLDTRTINLAAGEVKWYRVSVGGIEISDLLTRFYDVFSTSDASLGFYSENGNLLRNDTDDGPGAAPQLTFGIGRRDASGDGYQFDGRDGQLTADTVYWVGIAADPAVFGPAWTVTGASAAPATVDINFRSNVISGTLDPSVAPAGPNVTDLGQLLDPGAPGTAATPAQANGVIWTRFEICAPVTAANGKFLDIDFSGGGTGDQEAYIFNSAGASVATSDDDNGAYPQFSFGAPGPRGPYTPGFTAFNSEDGDLPAGTYFVGTGFFPVATLGTNDRWHLRVGGGSTLAIRTDFYTNILSTDCGGPSCPACPADFDNNGEVEPIDVRAFFNAFRAEDACADIDGNGELEPIDVRAFFNVFRNPGTDPDCPQ
jgi:hypothetical protein